MVIIPEEEALCVSFVKIYQQTWKIHMKVNLDFTVKWSLKRSKLNKRILGDVTHCCLVTCYVTVIVLRHDSLVHESICICIDY
jgi:hypothetical protein